MTFYNYVVFDGKNGEKNKFYFQKKKMIVRTNYFTVLVFIPGVLSKNYYFIIH